MSRHVILTSISEQRWSKGSLVLVLAPDRIGII